MSLTARRCTELSTNRSAPLALPPVLGCPYRTTLSTSPRPGTERGVRVLLPQAATHTERPISRCVVLR
jgi:hypothetical protein